MSRPKTRNSGLTPMFTIQINRAFATESLIVAKQDLGFSHWSDNKWYKALDNGPLTSEDAYDIERAFIKWLREKGDHLDKKLADNLEECASPDRYKDPS